MALVTTSNSFRSLKFTDKVSSGNSSSALDFGPLNSASTSTICGGRSEFSVSEYCVSGKVGKHDFSRRMWPSSSLLARPERNCNVRVNAGSTPESQTTDTEVDSSSSQGCSRQSKMEVKSVENNASSVGKLLSLTGSSAQSHLDLLQRLTSESSLAAAGSRKTIAQQLKEDLELEGGEEATIPLGSGKLDIQATDLTISQKRNIARQKYMDKVSQRNDAPFFTAVALFVLVPPIAILGVAVATGYVDLFP